MTEQIQTPESGFQSFLAAILADVESAISLPTDFVWEQPLPSPREVQECEFRVWIPQFGRHPMMDFDRNYTETMGSIQDDASDMPARRRDEYLAHLECAKTQWPRAIDWRAPEIKRK